MIDELYYSIFRSSTKALEGTSIFYKLQKSDNLRKIINSIETTFPRKILLHGDKIFKDSFLTAIKEFKATSFIETGTYLGFTTGFIARNFSNLPVYSCEVNKKNYMKARNNLKKYKNAHVILKSSEIFLKEMFDKGLAGDRPVIFLDAHWYGKWPLEEEIKIIFEKAKSAIIFIDDFRVDNNNFQYYTYNDMDCSVERIIPYIKKNKSYNLLFPNYGPEDAFIKDVKHDEKLTGYPIIVYNSKKEFNDLMKNQMIKRFFIDKSEIFKKK